MKLLELNELGQVSISPEALQINAFKAIWERDMSETKEKANAQLAFTYFMVSAHPDNPYRALSKEERLIELNNDIKYIENSDSLLLEVLNKYQEIENRKSITLSYIRTNIHALGKLKNLMDNLDIEERDGNNKLLHDPKTFNALINDTAKTVVVLSDLEKRFMQEELESSVRIKGDAREEYDI